MSIRAIAQAIDASPATVGDSIRRAQVAQLSGPLPEEISRRDTGTRPLSPCLMGPAFTANSKV
ncbi:MAG: hypothetical protein GKR94_17370 [Gammaproteobacteria bacterium]|nr:hypothetical protein [Gammaproteobacteria bacterium]